MRMRDDYADYRETVSRSFADWYGSERDSWTGADTNDRVTEFVVRSAPPEAGGPRRVLDIGCGRGHQTVQFAERLAADVIGLDLLDVWDAPAARRGSARMCRGDFLSFRDSSMDLVVDNGCLHHQRREEWSAWVRHGRALLRPGGVWVVSCFLSPVAEVVARPLPDGRLNWWLTEQALVELFATAGMTVTNRDEIDRHFRHRDGYWLKYLVVAFSRE
ncbi:hypothetical protein ALI144C_31525 [Actinosynnema sp. ALI-1.44]|uniref:class I SAM-dependent methyltransferase n=1 Tax=Actinosynnema sp. ALI-1.44 TaxID=1933779 RepID=UPI00097C74CD|nr:class I SAM-dependent methyltransferase [Actinosynnema sp. ALI-1.44]ONI77932.1 hypothetical protein ALI144C_31525 [Actinosynnema sp. ALI-1.44]